ncbi:DNA-directed RNA polymerase subunit beta''-like [Schistocerca gregaria]|uniref:DNA-directed RNA polymerase subunit beta''-like n=1 Tax=Schistocerca gregaria TaxID=7010 RepID=UPI00211E7D31|nr:DNA-directed RNA polymerase subunit beta''-like [Schistocerca gregaria]
MVHDSFNRYIILNKRLIKNYFITLNEHYLNIATVILNNNNLSIVPGYNIYEDFIKIFNIDLRKSIKSYTCFLSSLYNELKKQVYGYRCNRGDNFIYEKKNVVSTELKFIGDLKELLSYKESLIKNKLLHFNNVFLREKIVDYFIFLKKDNFLKYVNNFFFFKKLSFLRNIKYVNNSLNSVKNIDDGVRKVVGNEYSLVAYNAYMCYAHKCSLLSTYCLNDNSSIFKSGIKSCQLRLLFRYVRIYFLSERLYMYYVIMYMISKVKNKCINKALLSKVKFYQRGVFLNKRKLAAYDKEFRFTTYLLSNMYSVFRRRLNYYRCNKLYSSDMFFRKVNYLFGCKRDLLTKCRVNRTSSKYVVIQNRITKTDNMYLYFLLAVFFKFLRKKYRFMKKKFMRKYFKIVFRKRGVTKKAALEFLIKLYISVIIRDDYNSVVDMYVYRQFQYVNINYIYHTMYGVDNNLFSYFFEKLNSIKEIFFVSSFPSKSFSVYNSVKHHNEFLVNPHNNADYFVTQTNLSDEFTKNKRMLKARGVSLNSSERFVFEKFDIINFYYFKLNQYLDLSLTNISLYLIFGFILYRKGLYENGYKFYKLFVPNVPIYLLPFMDLRDLSNVNKRKIKRRPPIETIFLKKKVFFSKKRRRLCVEYTHTDFKLNLLDSLYKEIRSFAYHKQYVVYNSELNLFESKWTEIWPKVVKVIYTIMFHFDVIRELVFLKKYTTLIKYNLRTGFCQYSEYVFAFQQLNDSVFGSSMYMLTSFHGLHVIVGLIMLIVCCVRFYLGHFTATNYLGSGIKVKLTVLTYLMNSMFIVNFKRKLLLDNNFMLKINNVSYFRVFNETCATEVLSVSYDSTVKVGVSGIENDFFKKGDKVFKKIYRKEQKFYHPKPSDLVMNRLKIILLIIGGPNLYLLKKIKMISECSVILLNRCEFIFLISEEDRFKINFRILVIDNYFDRQIDVVIIYIKSLELVL